MRFSLKTLLWSALLIAVVMVAALAAFPDPVGVEVTRVTRGPLQAVVAEDGKTRVREKYTVSAPVSGRLSRIELNEGDYLTEETLLAVILPAEPQFLDKRSRAEATARLQASEAAVQRAESRLSQARIDADLTAAKFQRAQRLRPSGAISNADYDVARAEKLAAEQAIETATFDQEIARFERKMAQAALDQYDDDSEQPGVEPFEIYSPIRGRVLRVRQESSTVVAVGAPLIEVGDPSNLEIEIDVLSTDAVRIQTGADVTIEHWGGGTPLHAIVRVVEPGAFTKVSSLGVEEQRVNVIADFNEPPQRLATLGDGYRVEARIAVNQRDDALRVPSSALFRYQQQWHVLTVVNRTATLQAVEIGLQSETQTEVLNGLAEGDLVIEYPGDDLQPGSPVEITSRNSVD